MYRGIDARTTQASTQHLLILYTLNVHDLKSVSKYRKQRREGPGKDLFHLSVGCLAEAVLSCGRHEQVT